MASDSGPEEDLRDECRRLSSRIVHTGVKGAAGGGPARRFLPGEWPPPCWPGHY